MAGSGGGTDASGKKRARIEIIPLIDVIFFLLATFVLFTLSLNQSYGIQVTLPTATQTEPRDPADTITISVTADGTIGWNKDVISPDEFITRLGVLRATAQNPRVLINADEDASYQSVFGYILNEVRKADIDHVYFETRFMAASG